MGIYGDKKDYEQLVKENIEKANLLYNLNDDGRKLVEELLDKRERIRNKNGILANFKINRINSRIKKIVAHSKIK
jgi:hypothetical protein